MRPSYENWLLAQGYAQNTCTAQMYRVRKVESHYGELEEIWRAGKFEALVDDLTYSTEDERHGRPNPSRIPFNGDIRTNLASYRDAAKRYVDFLSSGEESEISAPAAPEKQRLALERDMQAALRRDIAALDPGLTIIDNGAERQVPSGRIDILCRDASGARVVLELKAGESRPDVIAQILGYMGDLMGEEPGALVRGIIIAQEFDSRTIAAARAIPNLDLMTYRVAFSFDKAAL